MKKVDYLVGVAVALLAFASCSENKGKEKSDENENPVVELEGYSYDVIAEVADADTLDSEGWQYCRAYGSGMMPKRVGNNDISQLRDTLERLGSVAFASEERIVPEFGDELIITRLNPDSTVACGSRHNMVTISMMTPNLIVWKCYAAGYRCAAAHGSYHTGYLNYRIDDGKILSLGDIMREGYEPKLMELIREKIKEEEVDIIVPVDSIGLPPTFQITSGGVNFIYGIYEIAPYATGEVSLDFSCYELDDVLAPGMMGIIYGLPEE